MYTYIYIYIYTHSAGAVQLQNVNYMVLDEARPVPSPALPHTLPPLIPVSEKKHSS